MTTPDTSELRHEIHMKMLSKSDSAKNLKELTVIPIGFAVSIALDLLRKSNLQRAIESARIVKHNFMIEDNEPDAVFNTDQYIKALQAELQQIEKEKTL